MTDLLDLSRFAKAIPFGDGRIIKFGLNDDLPTMAAELRRFADRVESGEVLLEKVQCLQTATGDEWCRYAVLIECCHLEKDAAEPAEPAREPIIRIESALR